jgi:pilus assembly protein Flp/PilA
MERMRNFFRDTSGDTAVEYGLLIALICIVCIIAIGNLGKNLSAVFTNVSPSSSPTHTGRPVSGAPPLAH